jgi:hypothetical protein
MNSLIEQPSYGWHQGKFETVNLPAMSLGLNGSNAFNRPSVLTRIEQTVKMDNEVAHVRIVHGLLRLGLPGGVRRCIIREHADCFDFFEILKSRMLEIDQLYADDEMEQLIERGA